MTTSLLWYRNRACNFGYLCDVLAIFYLNGNSIQNFLCFCTLKWANRRGRVDFDKAILNQKTEQNCGVELRPFLCKSIRSCFWVSHIYDNSKAFVYFMSFVLRYSCRKERQNWISCINTADGKSKISAVLKSQDSF